MARRPTLWVLAAVIAMSGALILALVQSYDARDRQARLEGSLHDLNERTVAIARELAEMRAQKAPPDLASEETREALRFLRTPVLEGLSTELWEGRVVKVLPFELKGTPDPRGLRSAKVAERWRADTSDVESTLPYPWPKVYLEQFRQPFYPDAVLMNLAALGNWVRAGGEPGRVAPHVNFLIERTRGFLTPAAHDGQLVTYRFDYPWHDRTFKSGWVSPYGNASVMAGLLYLHGITRDARLLDLARQLYNGLKSLEGRDKPWVTMVDESQYLWFEEYPLEGKKAHVLNGHLWITMVVAQYCQQTLDASACTAARAGLTTARRYLPEFRSPGRTNRYDLYVPYNADYDPERSVRYQEALFQLTGDPFFRQMAVAFRSDMSVIPSPSLFGR